MKRFFTGILLAGSAFFVTANMVACGNDTPIAKIIVINQKMPLVEWPDSTYIANLEEILSQEPVKQKKEAEANISMNTFKAPVFQLPGSVTGKKEPKKGFANQVAKNSAKKNNNVFANSQSAGAENFANKFSEALSKLQSDPSNSSLYKTVTAADGDDLFKLLKKTYGAGVQNLPRFYVLSALQSVNAGVALEHLNAGDKVRVPKI
ncbi:MULTISPECIES: hypothetical protein [unclassified Fibrobacter]|uniref:hypothetical protein n=1 Tax=unclassified Fibrobacter TaxID=2634177 RepID=UPI00201678CB|nr:MULTISPECIES: hypothetical protein [unclassified Fibrobacter]MCQ2099216.1 hypothetical protein [Fibrobacter sp.]